MLLYRTLRKVPGTTKVRLGEKRCDAAAAVVPAVCGAPTTDERIHAPVLHDASQIDYTAGIEVAPHYHQLLLVV